MADTLITVADIQAAYANVQTLADLEVVYDGLCGKQGTITQANKAMATLSPEEKKTHGALLQSLRQEAVALYEAKQAELRVGAYQARMEADLIDFSLHHTEHEQGHMNLLQKERRRMEDIMTGLGFMIYYGDDVVTKEENFYSVNIPATHPATEMHDTLFLYQKDTGGDNKILRTHTSAMQSRLMQQYGAPLKVAIPGKVYRYENLDASHDTVFWQLEGMMVDKGLSIAHLKDLLTSLLSGVLESEVEVRLRPAYFPFVEPGFEIDASCPMCKKAGCALCKQVGWIELLGAGLIHPNVLKAGGIDPEVYSGFAFGLGVNRLVAIKYGIKDIRFFTNGDMRFLQTVGG